MTTARQIRFWLLGFVLFLAALYLLRSILLPFVAGMAVAYFLDPVCDRLERLGLSRTLATTVVTIAFAIVVLALLLLLVPPIQGQIFEFINKLPDYLAGLRRIVLPIVQELKQRLKLDGLDQVQEALSGQVGNILNLIGSAIAGVVTSGLAIANMLSLIFITPVVTFYLLRDWDRIVDRVDSWLPRAHAETIREQCRCIDEILAGWVRGQLTVCIMLATYYAVGLSAVGLDFGLVVGLLSGLLSFIPFVGTITGFIASLGIALVQYNEWGPVLIVLAIFVSGQAIEGNFLTPKLVGDRVQLHPVWVIFALLAGGALFGFVGVLLALPVAAVIGVLARFALGRYLASRLYHGGAHRGVAPAAIEPPEHVDHSPAP